MHVITITIPPGSHSHDVIREIIKSTSHLSKRYEVETATKVDFRSILEGNNSVSLEELKAIVSETMDVPWKDIAGHSRIPKVVDARYAYIYLRRRYYNEAMRTIGKDLSNRDHSTVIYAYTTAQNRIRGNDELFIQNIIKIEKAIKEREPVWSM